MFSAVAVPNTTAENMRTQSNAESSPASKPETIAMPQVLNNSSLETLIARINKLETGSVPKWGKMTVEEMLTHCSTAVQMAMGEVPAKMKFSKATAAAARLLFIDVFPFPKGSPTAPELHPKMGLRKPEEFLRERDLLISQLTRLNATPDAHEFTEHPIFRKMGRKRWGQLVNKHMDHHLRQFGV
jgi:hypothetical protein